MSNYVRAIEIADGHVGQIVGALTRRPSYSNENWLVIVQTDHGEHDHPDPERSRIVFSIYSGPSAARGVIWPAPAIVDVCATVLTHMGVPINPAWNLDARVAGLPLAPTRYGTNLIFNGDAESNSGTNSYTPDRGIAWWFDLASTTLGRYGANAAFPTAASPGPANRGTNFFLGGTTNGYLLQRIDITDISADVDGPGVDYALTGWFGGAGSQEDWSALSVKCLNTAGGVLGSNSIGQVSASARGNATGLFLRQTNGPVPIGTRFVEFTLTNRVATGANDASADNLSFILTRLSPPVITNHGRTANGWQVTFVPSAGRSYVLERSPNLSSWTNVTLPVPGVLPTTTLVDTNAMATQAFYRLRLFNGQ